MVEPRAPVAAVPSPEGFTAELLETREDRSIFEESSRFATGLALASLYGAALGARAGGFALLRHAVGVPAAMIAVTALGVPALYIALALFDAPVEVGRVARAAVRAAASSGLVLAGLAPIAALYVVSSQSASGASTAAALGLFFAGALGLRGFLRDLVEPLAGEPAKVRTAATVACFCFTVFTAALAIRVAWATLPILGGGR